jgi:hypothetical protein
MLDILNQMCMLASGNNQATASPTRKVTAHQSIMSPKIRHSGGPKRLPLVRNNQKWLTFYYRLYLTVAPLSRLHWTICPPKWSPRVNTIWVLVTGPLSPLRAKYPDS